MLDIHLSFKHRALNNLLKTHRFSKPLRLNGLSSFDIFTGIVYPIVSHWAWTEEGWLNAGITYKDNGEDVTVRYLVRKDISD